jgi:hypothetical protein
MKFELFLSGAALGGVFASAVGLALNALPLAFFATAAGTLVLLVAAYDYARPSAYSGVLAKVHRRREALPLAG